MKLVLALALLVAAIPPIHAGTDERIAVVPGSYLVRTNPVGEADLGALVSPGWQVVTSNAAGDPRQVAERLSERFGGRTVVPNRLVSLAQTLEPLYPDQWALENTGQDGGLTGADIDAPRAWTYSTGANVVVAIIDSGANLNHPDLEGAFWVNQDEIANNGFDDDGNGHVDDTVGWDFVEQDADPTDTDGHGTGVAAIVAAETEGYGMAGLAPSARLMVLKACNPACPMAALVAAVDYATREGADVINLSLGGYGPFFEPLGDAITRAEAASVLVVAAAGNDGRDNDTTPFFPASFPHSNVVAVSSSNRSDTLSGFTNTGAGAVDLAAPGEDVLTAALVGHDPMSGTSFAAPHVAGTAALMLAIDPELTPSSMRERMISTAAARPTMVDTSVSGGRLDAGAAVFASSGPRAQMVARADSDTAPTVVVLDGSSSFDRSGGPLSHRWEIDGDFVGDSSVITVPFVDHQPHVVRLIVEDADGLVDETEVIVDLNGAPSVTVAATPTLGVAPLTIVLTADADDPDGDPVTIEWFVDGASIGQPSGVTITEPGVHHIEIEYSDGTVTRRDRVGTALVGIAFTDVTPLFELDIAWASATGVTVGCSPTEFCPSRPLTRGEAAAFLARFLRLPAGADRFVDDDSTRFEADIDALAAAGITLGCNPPVNDRYCPDRTVDRAAWAALLVRALGLELGGDAFVDDEDSRFEAEINALAAAGITRGCNPPINDRYCPDRLLTRSEAMAMLHRWIVLHTDR